MLSVAAPPRNAEAVARVLADLQDGEQLVLLRDVPELPEAPRHGNRKLNRRVAVRWAVAGCRAVDGSTIKLETMSTPSGRATTRAALRRFLAAINGVTTTSTPDRHRPASRRKDDTTAANNVLAGAGFKI